MDVTASQLQRNCSGSLILKQEIKKILKTFQRQIIEASRNGETRVVVSVPTNFNIISLNNTSAQTIIYHKLIEELESKGFNVKIRMDKGSTSCTYCIRWGISDNRDLNNMRDVIASHVIK